jgi:peptidyl-prolyl cis-trans isomerase C
MKRSLGFVSVMIVAVVICVASCSKEEATEETLGKQGEVAVRSEEWKDKTVVARIDGKEVTKGELAREEYRLTQRLMSQMGPEQLESMKDALRQRSLDNMINRILFENAIEEEGISTPKEEADSRWDTVKAGFASEEAFAQRLEQLAMTEQEMRGEIEVGLMIEQLLEKHTADIEKPGEKEARSYYDANPQRFEEPERVRASHILIATEADESEAQKAEKRTEAAGILDEIRNGADFAVMAAQYSDCPSKERGGDLGYFSRGRMVPEFEQAAFGLEVGAVSDVVETRFGYHIMKIAEHTDARTVPFEEASEGIMAMLENQRRQEAMNGYAEELRSEAQIEYVDTTYAPR